MILLKNKTNCIGKKLGGIRTKYKAYLEFFTSTVFITVMHVTVLETEREDTGHKCVPITTEK